MRTYTHTHLSLHYTCFLIIHFTYTQNTNILLVHNSKQLLRGVDICNIITLGISTCSQEGPTSEIITINYQAQPHTVTPCQLLLHGAQTYIRQC